MWSFSSSARRQAESKQRALRRRVNAILRNCHERSPRIDVHDASAALRPHQRNDSLHRNNRPQDVEVEDFVKKRGIDLLYGGRIAAPCIIYQTVDAVMAAGLRRAVAVVVRSPALPPALPIQAACWHWKANAPRIVFSAFNRTVMASSSVAKYPRCLNRPFAS